MTVLRVKESVSVLSPGGNVMVTLRRDAAYRHDDPLVKEYPWAFERDVEQATARGGERRK